MKPVLVLGGAIAGGSRVSDVDRAVTRSFRAWCAATLCWAGFGSAPVLAAELAYGAGYSLAYDSNITRVPSGEVAEFTQTLLGGFAYQERSVDSTARVLAQVERRDYLRKTYTDDYALFVDAAGAWAIVPKLFSWNIQDVARQARIDLTAPDTPSNRTNVNFLSTGPDFTFRLGPANTAAIGAAYGRLDVANASGDNERYSGYARWLHPLSAQTTLSANYEAIRVDFQDPISFTNYRQEDAFLRYETHASFNTLTIDAGASRVTPDGAKELTGPLARLKLWRQLTSESSLWAALESLYSNTGNDLLAAVVTSPTRPVGSGPLPATIVITNDVYYSKRGDIAYENQGGYLGFALRGHARNVDFQEQNQNDFDEYGGRIEGTWLFTGEARIRAYTDYLKRTFSNTGQTDTANNSGVAVTYGLTRNVNITVEGARLEQSSTLPGNNFVDRRVVLFLTYSSAPLYSVRFIQQ
jgi:hypothetical protein